MSEFRRIAMGDGLAAFRQHWRAHPLTRLVTTDVSTHALLARILDRYPGHDLLSPAPVAVDSIDTRSLAGIRVPVLVVNGARDTEVRRRAGTTLCTLLSSAEHALVPEAAHLPNLDAPAAYNQLLTEFARRHLPAAA
jgi:pimeloyl-ACP methyl ester carboxylesterase